MTSIAVAALAFLGSVLAHVLACRFVRPGTVVKFVALAIVAGSLLIGGLVSMDEPSDSIIAAGLVFFLAAELYVFLFTLAGASVSIAIVLRLADERLRPAEIMRLYDDALMVDRRLEMMQRAGLLGSDGRRWIVTGKGRTLSWIFGRLRRVLGRD